MIVVAVIMLHLTRLILRVMIVLGLVMRRLLGVLQTTKENARLIKADRKSRDWTTKYNKKKKKKNLLVNEKIIDH